MGQVSTHSRLKAAGSDVPNFIGSVAVSTHSRLKAAGCKKRYAVQPLQSFNTQPPKGGWISKFFSGFAHESFNTQPPKGGWSKIYPCILVDDVSTHSRLKAAGFHFVIIRASQKVSTHSRLKAAGSSLKSLAPSGFAAPISLNSQEKREREYNTALSVTPAFAIS